MNKASELTYNNVMDLREKLNNAASQFGDDETVSRIKHDIINMASQHYYEVMLLEKSAKQ